MSQETIKFQVEVDKSADLNVTNLEDYKDVDQFNQSSLQVVA